MAPDEPMRGPRVLAAPPAPPPPPEPVVLGDAAGRLELALGLGLNWLGDEEYDLFATSDVLPLASLRAGLTFWQSGRWSALGILGVQYGGVGATARGTRTHLDLGRALLGVEARAHVLSGVVGYGRLMGGATLVAARVGPSGDPASSTMLEPAAAIEGALGAAVRLYGSKNGPARSFRLEAYLEGGFDFVSDVDLVLQAGPGGPPRAEPLNLGVLCASGALMGLGLQGSY